MAATFIAYVRGFASSSFKLAAALTMAVVALAAIYAAADWTYNYPDRAAAKRAEAVRNWSYDLTSNIGVKFRVRTKLVAGTMLTEVHVDGLPEWANRPVNATRGFHLRWDDADGFTRVKKSLQLNEFTTAVNDRGEQYGLYLQYEEPASLKEYERLANMSVVWTVLTDKPAEVAPLPPVVSPAKSLPDHCAPNISKEERLRRLAQHGQVRQTGMGEYRAGGRVVTYLAGGGELFDCK